MPLNPNESIFSTQKRLKHWFVDLPLGLDGVWQKALKVKHKIKYGKYFKTVGTETLFINMQKTRCLHIIKSNKYCVILVQVLFSFT